VLSTDRVVHDLYAAPEVRDAVVGRFGPDVAPGGVVDRRAVADKVFGSEADRQWLEALLWPRVGQRMADWREEVDRRSPRPTAAVVEVPLLFESGMERAFDATIAAPLGAAMRPSQSGLLASSARRRKPPGPRTW
jgi:dephospho-CoA kinase